MNKITQPIRIFTMVKKGGVKVKCIENSFFIISLCIHVAISMEIERKRYTSEILCIYVKYRVSLDLALWYTNDIVKTIHTGI